MLQGSQYILVVKFKDFQGPWSCIFKDQFLTEVYSMNNITAIFNICFCDYASIPSARQHLSYGDCLEVKREYYQNCSVLGCVTQCSQSAAHLCEQFLQVQQIRFITLGPFMLRGGCLELYYCNMVEWSWCDSSLIWRPTGFLQFIVTVGLIIWPVKIVPEMTYNICVEWDVKPLHYDRQN